MKARKNRLVRLLCIAAFAAAVLIMPSAAFADDGGDGAEAGTIYWAVDADKNLTISDAKIAAPEGGTAGSFAAKESVSRPWGVRY